MPRKKSEPAVEAQQISNDPLDSIEQKATAPPIVEERRATRVYSEDILDITDQERGFTPEDMALIRLPMLMLRVNDMAVREPLT